VRFVVDKVALGQVFFVYFGFPCQSSFHRFLLNHYSPIIRGLYHRPVVAAVPKVSPHKLRKKYSKEVRYSICSFLSQNPPNFRIPLWLCIDRSFLIVHVVQITRYKLRGDIALYLNLIPWRYKHDYKL
jgi:hypothetical protein